MKVCKNKHKIPFFVLTITTYAVLIAGVVYVARQSPGNCPFVSMCNAAAPAAPLTKAKKIKLPTLLELGSKRCVPCQMMEPILADLTKEYAGILKVSFVDVWLKKNIAVAKKYKISSIPTQIFFDANGKELWRHTGYFSKDDILKKWKSLGYDLVALKKAKK